MQIKKGEHVFICGRTGSGKSVLEETYISGFRNAFILDTKGLFNWSMIPDIPVYTNLEDLISDFNGKNGKAIFRPNIFSMDSEVYDNFFKWIYMRKNTAVGIDEVMSLYTNSTEPLFWHKALMTRGRELGINVFNCTQRPKTIPITLISECTHFFVFDLQIEADRKRMKEVVGNTEIMEMPTAIGGDYSFWYYNFRMTKPVLGKLDWN